MAANPSALAGPKLSILQRLAQLAQGGIDAAASPNTAFGGVSDMFRAASRASDLALDREFKRSEERRRRNQELFDQKDFELRQKQYERLVRQQDIDREDKFADNVREDKKLQRTLESNERTAIPQYFNAGYRAVGPNDQIDPSRILKIGGQQLYKPTPEELAKEPLSGASLERLVSSPGMRSRRATSRLETTLSGTLQDPASNGPAALPIFQQITGQTPEGGSPTNTPESMSDLPLRSSMGLPVRLRSPEFKTPTSEGYDRVLEQGGQFFERPNPETLANQKSGNTQIVPNITGPDGKAHTVLVDKRTGQQIADLGETPDKENTRSTQQERYVQFQLEYNGQEPTPELIDKYRREYMAAQPPLRALAFVPNGQGMMAPQTVYGGGAPLPIGSTTLGGLTPNVPAGVQQRISGFKVALDQSKSINDILAKTPDQLFGPLAGRVTLAEIGKIGSMGATPQQVELATRLQRFLSSQAFADGGKQLTPTELEQFERVSPAMTDTLEAAIIKAKLSLEFIKNRGAADLITMPMRERAQFDPSLLQSFGVGGGGQSSGSKKDPKDMTTEELLREALRP